MNSKAFSLIELIITISILFVLSSIPLSLISIAKQQTLSLSCKNNLRQMGIALFLYAHDNRGKLPHGNRDSDMGYNYCWFDQIDTYLLVPNLHQVKQCPSWEGYTAPETTDEHSIKMNRGLCIKERLPETTKEKKIVYGIGPDCGEFRKKSKTVLLLDGRLDPPHNTYTDTRSSKPYYDIANRHLLSANILLLDGRVVRTNNHQKKEVGWENKGGYIWEVQKRK